MANVLHKHPNFYDEWFHSLIETFFWAPHRLGHLQFLTSLLLSSCIAKDIVQFYIYQDKMF